MNESRKQFMDSSEFFERLYQMLTDAAGGIQEQDVEWFQIVANEPLSLDLCLMRVCHPDVADPPALRAAIFAFLRKFFSLPPCSEDRLSRVTEEHPIVIHELLNEERPEGELEVLLRGYSMISTRLQFSTSDYSSFRDETLALLREDITGALDPVQLQIGLRRFKSLNLTADTPRVLDPLIHIVESIGVERFVGSEAYWAVGSLIFVNLKFLSRHDALRAAIVSTPCIMNLLFAVCNIVGLAHSQGVRIENDVLTGMIENAVKFGRRLFERFCREVRAYPEELGWVLAGMYQTCFAPFLELVLLSHKVFPRVSDAVAYDSNLLTIIRACQATSEVCDGMSSIMSEESLPQLLECILVILSGSCDTERFPSESCAKSLFYSRIVEASYPRMAGRQLFEDVFLIPRFRFGRTTAPAFGWLDLLLLETVNPHDTFIHFLCAFDGDDRGR
jgi:hypothetical protein